VRAISDGHGLVSCFSRSSCVPLFHLVVQTVINVLSFQLPAGMAAVCGSGAALAPLLIRLAAWQRRDAGLSNSWRKRLTARTRINGGRRRRKNETGCSRPWRLCYLKPLWRDDCGLMPGLMPHAPPLLLFTPPKP